MKKVFFVLPDGRIEPSLMFLAIEILDTANQYFIKRNEAPYYNIKIVGIDLSQNLWGSHLHIDAQYVHQLSCPDLIIIPGGSEKNDYSKDENKNLAQWMVEQYQNGAELASLCTGAFF